MAKVKIVHGHAGFLESMEINLLRLNHIEEFGRNIVVEMRNSQCTVVIILSKEELYKIIKELRKANK